ncbi:MAG: GYDIA family GHMP kinase, partial [Pseudomonadota bacterium]
MSDVLQFSANGKLLLTGEYFILDGAKGLALPTQHGQSMAVTVRDQQDEMPQLEWMALDGQGKEWFRAQYSLNDFVALNHDSEEATTLGEILRQTRLLDPNFLSDKKQSFCVQAKLEFPRNWGLGSSSTLISMVAQWADICPFELLKNTLGGSGYDIACAQSGCPLIYRREGNEPSYNESNFNPVFQDHLYFVHLNQKQSTKEAIQNYKKLELDKKETIKKINQITQAIITISNLEEFENCLNEHEKIISKALNLKTAKEKHFPDYWGAIKSLGAWGGDFVLVTSDRSQEETKNYFSNLGYKT